MKTKIIILSVMILAALLRFWRLGSVPPGLTPDEAALGYNAYSILTTGRDEHGDLLPIIFTSFADYKPGLYVYFTVPFLAAFGLNEWTVRMPSAVAGVFSVYLIYLIVLWFIEFKKPHLSCHNLLLGKITAFSATFSPWLIHFSRGAWEANVMLTLTLAGVYFYLKSFQKSIYLFLSTIFFALTFLTYQGAKLSTPIVIIALLITFRKETRKLWNSDKVVFIKSFIIGLVLVAPIILSFVNGRTGRLSINSVFSYPRPADYTNEFLRKAGDKYGSPEYYLYHSEALNFARGIFGRWFDHYSGRFLFFGGDYQNPRHSSPNHGMLLLVDFILVPFGIFFLIRKNSKLSKFLFLWLFLAPLPAALSRDQVHAVRALNMSVPLAIISGFGLYSIFEVIKNYRFRLPVYLILSSIFILSFVYYLDSYYVHLPKQNAKYWFYGFKEAVREVLPVMDNYDKIIFQQSYSQPYIYFLFYGAKEYPAKFSPKVFQKQERFVGDSADVSLVNKMENIEFQFFSWPPAVNKEKTLIVGDEISIPSNRSYENFNLVKEIKNPDGFSTAFRVVEKNE